MNALLVVLGIVSAPLGTSDWVSTDSQVRICFRQQTKYPSGQMCILHDEPTYTVAQVGYFFQKVRNGYPTVELVVRSVWRRLRNGEEDGVWRYHGTDLDRASSAIFEMDEGDGTLTLSHVGNAEGKRRAPPPPFTEGQIMGFRVAKSTERLDQNPPGLSHLSMAEFEKLGKSSVYHATTFFESEQVLQIWPDNPYSEGGTAFLQFAPSDDIFNGSVWFFRDIGADSENNLFAGRGTYSAYRNSEQPGHLFVDLSFPRTYIGQGTNGRNTWRVDNSVTTGLTFAIPLLDQRLLYVNNAYVSDVFYVDSSGQRIAKYNDAGWFRLPKEQRAYGCMHFVRDDSITFSQCQMLLNGSGYQRRLTEQTIVNMVSSPPVPSFQVRFLNNSEYYRSRIRALVDTSPTSAIWQLGEAIAKFPEDTSFLRQRGDLHFKLKEYKEAARDYERLLDLRRDDPPVLWQLAQCRYNTAEYRLALVHLNRVVELLPRFAEALSLRARCASQLEQWTQAIADWRRLTALEPTKATAFNGAAWLLATCPDEAARDGKEAMRIAARACDLTRHKDPVILDTLAAACATAGDFEAAVRWQTAAWNLADSKNKDDYWFRLELFKAKVAYFEGTPYRVWRDASGNYKTVAMFIKSDGRSVLFRKAGISQLGLIPIEQLSEPDRRYVAAQLRSSPARDGVVQIP